MIQKTKNEKEKNENLHVIISTILTKTCKRKLNHYPLPMSKISLIIQSRGTLHLLKHMLACYRAQSHTDRELILVIDEPFTQESFYERKEKLGIQENDHATILSELTTHFPHQNVSAMRNI